MDKTKRKTSNRFHSALVIIGTLRGAFIIRCVHQCWITLAGVSLVTVIASELWSQTRCVAVMQGNTRVDKVISKRGASCTALKKTSRTCIEQILYIQRAAV